MLTGPLLKKLLLFGLPLMASSILQLLFNAADVVVLGRYANYASLAAVGGTTAIVNLVVNLLIGMAVAFVVSVFAIKFLMGYIRRHDFKAFGWYRIVLGIIVILYAVIFA